jgi:hypothetical protein
MSEAAKTAEMAARLAALSRAVDDGLVSAHGLLHDLLEHHKKAGTTMPPFVVQVAGDSGEVESRRASLTDGLAHYGAGPLFNLWSHLVAMDRLRTVWIGK